MSTAFETQVRRPFGIQPMAFGATAPALLPDPRTPDEFGRARPDLEVVAAPSVRRARPRVLFAATVVGGVAAVLAVQLLLSIQTDATAFTVSHLQARSVALTREAQVETEAIERLASPQHLATAAGSLGMVRSTMTPYLRASDGTVLGAADSTSH